MKQYLIICKDGYEMSLITGTTLKQAQNIASQVAQDRDDICLLYVRNGEGELNIAPGDAFFQPERMARLWAPLTQREAAILARAKGRVAV